MKNREELEKEFYKNINSGYFSRGTPYTVWGAIISWIDTNYIPRKDLDKILKKLSKVESNLINIKSKVDDQADK